MSLLGFMVCMFFFPHDFGLSAQRFNGSGAMIGAIVPFFNCFENFVLCESADTDVPFAGMPQRPVTLRYLFLRGFIQWMN